MLSSKQMIRWVLPACLIAGGGSLAWSQVVRRGVPAQQGINPESMYGKESAQGVYVRDSAVALEKFAQAQRMERLKEWAKAADLYQEVLEKFADRVVPSQVDKDNNIYQYTSVIAAVQQKMSHWPADGLEVYRARYESAAQTMLDNARPDDRAALQAIISRYFATDTAKIAGMRLMDLYFEAGEFPAAAWLGDLLLTQHPNLIVERPRVLYRCALAYHMSGEQDRSSAVLAELQTKYPQETATIRGADQKLADSLASELAQAAPPAAAVADSAWPMFGGSPSHARLSTAAGRPGAKLYSIDLSKPNFKGLQGDQSVQLKQRDRMDQDSGATIGVMPVVDHGELYFQDGMRLYAVSIESGQPLPKWMETYPGDQKGEFTVASMRIPPRAQLETVTLTDHSVLAVMGQTDRFAQAYGGAGPGEAKLVCLDRAAGAKRWMVQSRDLPDEAAALRGAELTGSPLVVDDNVYIVARSSKGAQFEDCYVLCFDLETGKYKWNCYVASANSVANAMMFDGDMPPVSDTAAQLAYSSGRLYVLTNLGALAAVDAYGGRIVWLSIYTRDQSANQGGMNMWQQRMNGGVIDQGGDKPWMTNPVVVDNGKVFAFPSDGKFLQIYDAGTGVEVKRMDPKQLGAAECLIAVNGNCILTTGKDVAAYTDWTKYDAATFKKYDPSILWQQNFAGVGSLRGRAFVANNRVFFPAHEKLSVVVLKGGKATNDEYPKFPKKWDNDDSEGPGNVVVSDEHVVIAANRRIDVYTNMDAARQKLDRELAKDPNSPEPRLRYAEVMFVAGEVDTATQKLDEAIQLLGGREKMSPGLNRDRVYNDSVLFAQKLGKDIKDANTDSPAVEQLYDRAGAAANSPSQQVNYRVLRAKLATTIHDYPLAVKLYQEIITNSDWRKVPVMDEATNTPSPANRYAQGSIETLIHTAGPLCYAAFEQEAIQQFNAAKTANQGDALISVAANYPNAKVAPQALLAAADLREAGGDHRNAVQLLRQLYLTYPNAADKRRVLESLARNYLGIPNRSSVAVARLAEAVKMAGGEKLTQPLPLPGGKTIADVTLTQALAELKKAQGQEIAKSLPDFKLPIPNIIRTADGKKKLVPPFEAESAKTVMANVQALVVPARDFQRTDRVATYNPGDGLVIYAAGSTQPLTHVPMSSVPGLAWSPQGPIAWSLTQASQLRGDSSDSVWQFDLKNVPAVEVVASAGGDAGNSDTKSGADAQGDNGEVQIQQNMAARVIINGNRRLIVQNGVIREFNAPVNGQVAAVSAPGGGEAIVDVRPIGDTVLVTTTTGRLVGLDGNDGRIRWQTRVGDHAAERVVSNEDFVVLVSRDDNTVIMTALDMYSGQVIGRRTFDDGFHIPVNLVLSPDGTLVYTMPDRIVLKNLYEPWTVAEREIVDAKAAQTGQFPYINAQSPDQLQVVDGRILVMSDQNVTLRVFSMETGKPVRYTPVDSTKEIDMAFQTGSRQPNTPLIVRVVGPQVYLIGQQTVIAYNIDHPEQSWREDTTPDRTIDAFVGRNHLVLLADTNKRINAGKVAGYRLLAFGRYGSGDNDPAESGALDYRYLQTDPSGILNWQAVDGGFYYLSADQKLHFLKGLGS